MPHDAFCTLPDSVLALILSKLPINHAVKSSILSKRWRFLYTQMPELTFHLDHLSVTSRVPRPMSNIENIISNILLMHSGNLEAFHLPKTWLGRVHFSSENVCKWVRYASRCNVKHLTLFDDNYFAVHTENEVDNVKETPPPALFSCTYLASLRLRCYDLSSLPITFVGFPHLIACYLCDVQLTDEFLVSLISLCPLLQKLEIVYSMLGTVKIFSATIEHLAVDGVKSLSVNCPKLKILSGGIIEDLSVNGLRFDELSDAICKLEMHCEGTLGELEMLCSREWNNSGVISASRFLHIMGNLKSLKRLVIYIDESFEIESDMNVPLFHLLHKLPNLQVLSIVGFFVRELARDHIPVCLPSPHLNLKKIRIEILKFDHNEVAVINCLLQSTPSLEVLQIQLPYEYDKGECLELFKEIMSMRRASLLVRIIVLEGELEARGEKL